MRFWSPFHRYSLDILSSQPNALILRAPDRIRLRMTVDHLEAHQNPGSSFTHYNYDTCLWECYHSPRNRGHHRLIVWALDVDNEDEHLWVTAVRVDVDVREARSPLIYPLPSELFNRTRCQLIGPSNGVIARRDLPRDLVVCVPEIDQIQLQLDERTVLPGEQLRKDIYRISLPTSIDRHVKICRLMCLCSAQMYYSVFLTFTIE